MPLPTIDLTTASDMELVVLASRISREQDARRKRVAAEDALRATVQNLLSAGGDPAAILASLEPTKEATPAASETQGGTDAPPTDESPTETAGDTTTTPQEEYSE